MREAGASRTALRVAMRRAAHQVLDKPVVFEDPYALPILGDEIAAKIRNEDSLGSPSLRAFVAVRSRFAEDELAIAYRSGIRQYVILGAGFDTFAHRNPHAGLHIFEVDHPATQAAKRNRLEAAGIAIRHPPTYAAIDFEHQTLAAVLDSAGFEHNKPAFFSWLGVVPYLIRPAFEATLGLIASMPTGSAVVFDYAIDKSSLGPLERAALDHLATRVAAAGEPFQLFIGTDELGALLTRIGFHLLTDLGSREINERYFSAREDSLKVAGAVGRLMHAGV